MLSTKQKVKREELNHVFSDTAVYASTVLGVLSNKYLPRAGQVLSVSIPSIAEVIAAVIAATLVTYFLERGGDREGKRRNFRARLLKHFAYGMMWNTIFDILKETL